jgi:hypothetical protein
MPSRKIELIVDKIVNNEIFYRILKPGNKISIYTNYVLLKKRDPSKTLTIFSLSTSYCVECVEETMRLLDKNFMIYFINSFLAIPFYAVITNATNNSEGENLLYIENPSFFYVHTPFIDLVPLRIYYKVGCLQYYSFNPNLPLPIPNSPLACFNVTISSLTLPNLPICGTNFILADFPFVFVTFGNLTNNDTDVRGGTITLGNLTSNNPNALTATFLCAIANIRSPDILKYVVVRSSQVVPVKLNLAESLRFSVFLPDGSLIRYSNRYEINILTNTIVSSSLNCSNDYSLTHAPDNSLENSTTRVYSYDEMVNISATFLLTQI